MSSLLHRGLLNSDSEFCKLGHAYASCYRLIHPFAGYTPKVMVTLLLTLCCHPLALFSKPQYLCEAPPSLCAIRYVNWGIVTLKRTYGGAHAYPKADLGDRTILHGTPINFATLSHSLIIGPIHSLKYVKEITPLYCARLLIQKHHVFSDRNAPHFGSTYMCVPVMPNYFYQSSEGRHEGCTSS